MERTKLQSKSLLFALMGAFIIAFALSLSLTSPAEAASTKKPYAGYKYTGQTQVFGSGNLSMETSDARKVKKGYDSFYVYSNNTEMWDGKTESYVPTKKALKKLKGMSYNKKKNTLTLKNVKAPTYTLNVSGMGTGFKIVLKGKNQLAGIYISSISKYDAEGNFKGNYPSSVKIDGKGSLVLNKKKYNGAAITLYGGGTKSTITITSKPKVQLYAYGVSNVIYVSGTTAKKSSKAIALKGKVQQQLIKRSVKVPGYTSYIEDYVRITAGGSDWMYKLNGGKFWAKASDKAVRYFDTKTRRWYYNKWDVYKLDKMEYGTPYVSLYKAGVANKKDLPKGYTGAKDESQKTSYTHVIQNALVAVS